MHNGLKNMKVAYCILGTFSSGGIERVLVNKANALVKRGVEVHIITTDQAGKDSFYPLDEHIQCHDLGIDYLSRRNRFYWQKVYHYWNNIRLHKKRLAALLKRLRVDIVVSVNGFETPWLPDIHDESKKILEFHVARSTLRFLQRSGVRGLFDRYLNEKMFSAIKKYDRFIILTKEDVQNWSEYKNVEVIPNAKTFEYDYPVAALDNKRVIAVGHYTHRKGFERLIQAWSLISEKAVGWTLHIVGDGEMRQPLQCQIDKLGLSDSVYLDGVSSNIKDEYIKSSIFALSSYYEGLPMVLLEAESLGIPVVSFACPSGPRDIITDGEDGFLIPDGDIEQLAMRLLELMKDDKKRKEMGRKAFINSNRFTEEKIMEKWMDLFHRLTNK